MNATNESNLQGGCACGAIRYRLLDRPMITQVCHCHDCQKLSGSAFVINMWIEADKVSITGEQMSRVQLAGGSGKPHHVFFCGHCGTTLMSRYHAAPGRSYFVRAGTLDDPAAVIPQVHVHTASKLPWLKLDGSIPQFTGFYNIKTVWPKDSLNRLLANSSKASS